MSNKLILSFLLLIFGFMLAKYLNLNLHLFKVVPENKHVELLYKHNLLLESHRDMGRRLAECEMMVSYP